MKQPFNTSNISLAIKKAGSDNWDESKHPREPAGTDKGGEFTNKENGVKSENMNTTITLEKIKKNGKKIYVSADNTYGGVDIERTEKLTSVRVLEAEEVFYHFSIYSPDELGNFAPIETCFFDSKFTSSGHVYRYTAKKGTEVKEYSNETRLSLKEGDYLIYLGVTKDEKTGRIVNKGVGNFEETKKRFKFSDDLIK